LDNKHNKLIQDWLNVERDKIEKMYVGKDHLRPKDFASNEEALACIEACKPIVAAKAFASGNKRPGVGEVAEMIIEKTSVMIVPTVSGHTVAFWDYDEKKYTFDVFKMLNDYVTILLGSSSQSILNNLTLTLIGMRRNAVIYNELPPYLVPVGNGIYNCLTKELEKPSAYYAVLTKISTNYEPNAKAPVYEDGFNIKDMITSLANGRPEREMLLKQIVKSILLGHSLKPGLFVVLGRGGDGKSTFFTMIANMIGQENVAYVNFSQLEDADKMAETVNKKFVLGIDNDPKLYIKKTAILKTIASHEMITLSRKYLSAISVPFTATMVQLCNEFPRIAETGSSIKRRIVPFKAENSYYERGTENDNVDNIYCKDKSFLEYALKFFLEESTNPYYSDYNDIDRSITLDALSAEDTIGQFISELEMNGILDGSFESLPATHLYAAYLDWAESSNVSALSSKNFSMQIAIKLDDYGYEFDDRGRVTRPTTLERANVYDPANWGSLLNSNKLASAIESNRSTRIFTKVKDAKEIKEVRRRGGVISATDYFKITSLLSDAQAKKRQQSAVKTDVKPKSVVKSNQDDKTNIYALAKSDAPKQAFTRLRKNLLELSDKHANNVIDDLAYSEELNIKQEQMKKLARSLKDVQLMNIVSDIEAASLNNVVWLMSDFIDTYLENKENN
jgi:P4 family phage/plasmid primase-like protien